MANNVTAVSFGAQPKVVEVGTINDLVTELGVEGKFTVKVNGKTVTDLDAELSDYDHVQFGEAVKGGC